MRFSSPSIFYFFIFIIINHYYFSFCKIDFFPLFFDRLMASKKRMILFVSMSLQILRHQLVDPLPLTWSLDEIKVH